MNQNQHLKYTIVIPLKDEEENVIDLVCEIEPVMEQLNEKWELIMVNDGSTDGTAMILDQLKEEKTYLHIITFDKNYGQTSAFDAGFKAARGEFIITLDGDRQNDPNDIPRLVSAIKHCDLVCGQRIQRRDPFSKRIISSVANWIRSRICKDGMTDTGCSLKIYKASCLRSIKLFNGMHRFLPALFVNEGYRVSQIPVNHRERVKGKTKYNLLNRSINTVIDMWAVLWMRRRRLNYHCIDE